MDVRIFKDDDKWDDVQDAQHEPFIYIMSNGSKLMGDELDDISDLLEALAKYRLDYRMFGHFYTVNPCHWAYNPSPNEDGLPRYIDGKRMYECDGVYHFFGNFESVSHVFRIDTNHQPTIDALVKAIDANKLIQEEVAA